VFTTKRISNATTVSTGTMISEVIVATMWSKIRAIRDDGGSKNLWNVGQFLR
jgi:hypothetical protein